VATVRTSIDVAGPRTEVAAAWAQFIDSVLVGRRKLACDELACVDPVRGEFVGFEPVSEGCTRVIVTIPADDALGEGGVPLLEHKASHDLVVFRDYVESGEFGRAHAPAPLSGAGVKEDVRRGRFTRHDARPDPDALSVRRSGRT